MHAIYSKLGNLISDCSTLPLPVQCGLSAAAGILSHLCIFIRGEHHLQAPFLFRLYILLGVTIFISKTIIHSYNVKVAGFITALLMGSYAAALFSSMIIYRVFFHRLRPFPGPPLAKLSKLWHMSQVLDAKQYLFLDSLHAQYGDYVRTGTQSVFPSIIRQKLCLQ